jgi:glutathione S-transferase
MKLLTAGASPYGRKAKMTALIKGLTDQIEFVTTDSRPADNPDLRAKNPLSKIPALVLDDGMAIYDSKVICEYLDSQVASNVLFPGDGRDRWETLTLGALGDGIMDAALLLVYEKRFRPEEKWVDDWIERQQLKIDGALDHLEANPPEWGMAPTYGHLTVAAALGYLDFRHDGKWREGRPKMVAWLEKFAEAVPAYGETMPQ